MADLEWSQIDLRRLVENIQQLLPKGDSQTFQTTQNRIEWDKIKFDGFSAQECQEKWVSVASKVRRFRTLTEMVGDALDWVEHPWQNFYKKKKNKLKNPLLPTKPLGIYIRFFKNNRERVAKDNAGAPNNEISKIVGGLFNSLNEKKKAKLQQQCNTELEEYKEEIVIWKEVYPEDVDDKHLEANHAPKLPTSRGLFVRQKLETSTDEDIEVRRELARESFKRYNDLKEKKRHLWDEQLESLKQQYQTDYSDLHPDDLPPHLRKAPPKNKGSVSGYNLFTKETMVELMLTDKSGGERLAEISRRWRAMSPAEKAVFNDKAKLIKEMKSEEVVSEQEEEEEEDSDSETEGDAVGSKKPSQPVNAMFLFLEAKTKLLKEKEPDLSEAEVRRLLVHAFNKLPERKKQKYEEMAQKRKQQQPQTKTSKAKKAAKSKPKSNGPKKQTAYNAFCRLKSREWSDLPASERMPKIVALWRTFSAEEKAAYQAAGDGDVAKEEPSCVVAGSKRKQASPTKVVKQAKLDSELVLSGSSSEEASSSEEDEGGDV